MPAKHAIIPTCRYEHGDLVRVTGTGHAQNWVAVMGYHTTPGETSTPHFFRFCLYVCPGCGYTEFFDEDPEGTIHAATAK